MKKPRIVLSLFLSALLHIVFGVACTSKDSAETVLSSEPVILDELQEVPVVERRDVHHDFRYLVIDDSVSIYYFRKGSGVPMVVLNGGPGNSSHSFIPYFDKATEFCDLILYDPRGVGKSDWKPGPGYSTQQLLGDLEKIRAKLNIEQWVVAGWSYGGLAAQHYALQFPERVLGLVLINSAYSANYEFDDESYPDHLTDMERQRMREIYSIDKTRVVPVHSDEVSLEALQTMVYNGYLNGGWKRQFFLKPTIGEMAAVARYEWNHDKDYNRLVRNDAYDSDLSGSFSDFEKPVLLYYGKYDMTYSTELAEEMRAEFPNSNLVMMSQSSHNPFKEEPDLFFSVLKNFISKGEW